MFGKREGLPASDHGVKKERGEHLYVYKGKGKGVLRWGLGKGGNVSAELESLLACLPEREEVVSWRV